MHINAFEAIISSKTREVDDIYFFNKNPWHAHTLNFALETEVVAGVAADTNH